jgi:hypothetical protein
MILILVNPAITLFRRDHKFVVSETGVYKRIYKGSSKIGACRIDSSRRAFMNG